MAETIVSGFAHPVEHDIVERDKASKTSRRVAGPFGYSFEPHLNGEISKLALLFGWLFLPTRSRAKETPQSAVDFSAVNSNSRRYG